MHAIFFFFFNDTATTEIYTLSLHDALPISYQRRAPLRLPLVPRNGCGRPGRAPERFLPLDITSLLLHVIFKGKKRSGARSEERFSRNAETDLVCRLLLEKKKRPRARVDTGSSAANLTAPC